MARKFFQFYYSYLPAIEPLTDVERGRLFSALLEYSVTGRERKLEGNERFIYPLMRDQVDRDNRAYDEKVKKLSKAGKKGGMSSAANRLAADDADTGQANESI